MQAREAKDFLVRQTEIQAAMDGVTLSDQEKKLMYFTEDEETEEEPEEDSEEGVDDEDYDYERKISGLLRGAYRRVKKENPEDRRLWDEAIRALSQGDHYLLVLWNGRTSQKLISKSFWKLLAVGLLVLVIAMVGFAVALQHADSMPPRPKAIGSLTPWIQRLLLALMIGSYLAFLLLPRFIGRIFLRVRNSNGKTSQETTAKRSDY
jgi:hypothetical protein